MSKAPNDALTELMLNIVPADGSTLGNKKSRTDLRRQQDTPAA